MNMQNLSFNRARGDNGMRALSEDELRDRAPSIFAVERHHSRSERFQPIPTIEVVRALIREGFQPVGARQSRARDEDRRDYTKHVVRFRQFDDMVRPNNARAIGDTHFEILLKNANDGTSAYDLLAGLFRLVCLNGMVVGTNTDVVKVRHSGDVKSKVIEGTARVLQGAPLALAAPSVWSGIQLDTGERMALASAAHVLRFADTDGEVNTPVKAEQLLTVRRTDDSKRDLWTTFNIVQENVMKGGLSALRVDPATRRSRRMTTRPVNGIDQDVKLNKALWVLADKLAEAKGIKTVG